MTWSSRYAGTPPDKREPLEVMADLQKKLNDLMDDDDTSAEYSVGGRDVNGQAVLQLGFASAEDLVKWKEANFPHLAVFQMDSLDVKPAADKFVLQTAGSKPDDFRLIKKTTVTENV
jgi:hypothetical protein